MSNGTTQDTGATAALFSTPHVELATGKKVEIRKVSLRTLPAVLSFMESVLSGLDIQGGMPMVDLLSPTTILKLISNNLEKTYDIACLLSSVSMDELLDMDMEDSLSIILKIVEVNRTFFTEKLFPKVQGYLPQEQ